MTEAEIQKDEEMRAKLAYERLSAVQKLFHHIKESRAKAYKLLVHYGPPYKDEYGGNLCEECNDAKPSRTVRIPRRASGDGLSNIDAGPSWTSTAS